MKSPSQYWCYFLKIWCKFTSTLYRASQAVILTVQLLCLSLFNPDCSIVLSLSSQYFPIPEVPGSVGVGAASRLCTGVQVWVPVALLAFHQKCLRLVQIPGAGKRCLCVFQFSSILGRKSFITNFLLSLNFWFPPQAFSVFFVCVAFTSDIICLLFIPVQWLFFAASTYVWVQYVWHTGQCAPLHCLSLNIEMTFRKVTSMLNSNGTI